ncbi:hypothetical protein SKAU_G00181760 [Synaphobranchus kaupii]|uniref:Beta-microseminoprotein n=1 Tax=Synaphobranchus kaupii TaxID=118154 RepID=A0A9Q1J0T7_SYNKA|nr:hypothetical protein SKAU_G00181760 [Synaphobranchus kaupii]
MRVLLCSVVTLLAFATVCKAQCYFNQLEVTDIMNPPTGCKDQAGKMHKFGSEWVQEDCYECSCTDRGLSCCNMIPTSMDLPPECELVVDKKNCKANIMLKSDNTKECALA